MCSAHPSLCVKSQQRSCWQMKKCFDRLDSQRKDKTKARNTFVSLFCFWTMKASITMHTLLHVHAFLHIGPFLQIIVSHKDLLCAKCQLRLECIIHLKIEHFHLYQLKYSLIVVTKS